MNALGSLAAGLLVTLRRARPLVHHITNFVVMNDTANVTLHIGALPVMAHARDEVAEMVAQASVLLLNMGTPTAERVDSMLIAGHQANQDSVPIVVDPVGVGATALRTESSLRLLKQLDVAILRGNLGEVAVLAGLGGEVRGVESIAAAAEPADVARAMAQRWNLTAALTGKRDIISDGRRLVGVDNGHPWLRAITGSGCMASTVVAAFAAVESDPVLAATAGLVCFGVAAERAAAEARGPASFKVALLDALHQLTPDQVRSQARARWVELEDEHNSHHQSA